MACSSPWIASPEVRWSRWQRLAISESQSAGVCRSAEDVDEFLSYANRRTSAVVIATVTEEPRVVMTWRGDTIVDVSREFLNSNGASKQMNCISQLARTMRRAGRARASQSA